jgi:hypothetical protein
MLPLDRNHAVGRKIMESTIISDTELAAGTSEEELLVHAWRAEQLRRLGLSRSLAVTFAGLVDWHEISVLVERGCPVALALEIAR